MSLRLARLIRETVLCRGTFPGVARGWRQYALPLTNVNQDPTPPFPVAAAPGSTVINALATAAPLTLYRTLYDGSCDGGDVLCVVRSGGVVTIAF